MATHGLSSTNMKHCKIFWVVSVSQAIEIETDTAVGYFVQEIRAHQVDLFYNVSTGSEHDIFPFHTEWLSKGRESWKKNSNILRKNCHSQWMLKQTLITCRLRRSKNKFEKRHSDGELRPSEMVSDPQIGTFIGLHLHVGQVDKSGALRTKDSE